MTRLLSPRKIRYVLLALAGLGAVFLFLLATASANTGLFARNYNLLLVLNGAMVALLMVLVGYQLWRLRRNLKAGVFGSRLAVRLVLLFALVAVVPGALLYGVSMQFLGKSIESWFDVRVDRALEGGLNLGRSALDYLLKETANKATQLALTLQEAEPGAMAARLSRASEQAGVYEAALFSASGARARGRRGVGVDAHAAAPARPGVTPRASPADLFRHRTDAGPGTDAAGRGSGQRRRSPGPAAPAASRRAGREAAATRRGEGAGRLQRLPGDFVLANRTETALCADADADAAAGALFRARTRGGALRAVQPPARDCSPKARARSLRAISADATRCTAATSSAFLPNRSTR